MAALDPATGNVLTWGASFVGEAVFTLRPHLGVIYIGGIFNSINWTTRNNLAALDEATGAPTSWNPNANAAVRALHVYQDKLLVGGSFTTLGGQAKGWRRTIRAGRSTPGILPRPTR